MVNLEIANDDERNMRFVDPIGEIHILIHEIYLLVKFYLFENARWCEQRVTGIHLDIVSLLVSQVLWNRSGKPEVERRKTLILDLTGFSVHQGRCENKVPAEFFSIFESEL